MDRGEKGLPDGGVDGDSVVAAMAVSNGGEKETCERGYCSSLSLCYALLLLFDSCVPSVNNVLPSLQRLRGGAGGGGLGSGLDGGRPFFFFFSVFFFCSILLCFCFILFSPLCPFLSLCFFSVFFVFFPSLLSVSSSLFSVCSLSSPLSPPGPFYSSFSPLFLLCSPLFCLLLLLLMVFSAVNKVLPSLQRLRGGAGGRA